MFDDDQHERAVTTPDDIGEALRSARKRQGLTQQDFADLSMVGVRFLSELERGKETAELGPTLQVLQNAGYDVVLRRRSATSPARNVES